MTTAATARADGQHDETASGEMEILRNVASGASMQGGKCRVLCHDGGMISTRPKATTLAGRPNQPLPMSGQPTRGRIVKIHAGQSNGYIRSDDNRDVFFHRADTTWGTFNNLAIGDAVAFELIEDRVSGPRATRVRTLA
jgi:cold shock CspA family protein